jgi:alpha-L-rhamnosidase
MLKKKDYPGYLYMIENGATATWEHWNGNRSRIHNCYNGIGAWFYQAIGGIRPDETFPGYRRVIISPQVPAGISWAKTSKETPLGEVAVDWEVRDGRMYIDLTIPPGCTGLLELPEYVSDFTIDDKPHHNSGSTANEIKSGNYTIVYRIN